MDNQHKTTYRVGEAVRIITNDPDVLEKGIVQHRQRHEGETYYIVESGGSNYARYATAIWPDLLPPQLIDDLVAL